MISADTRRNSQVRIYDRAESAVFLKTNEELGGLSNMAGGFPLSVNGHRIFSSEALYQACRFPHMPEIQRVIIAQASPMTAKMKSKPYRSESRPDWNRVRVKVMRWCLRVKLAQNWTRFSELLLATGSRPIVEFSRKDEFWGAKPVDERTLVGMNVLGRLLMELREEVRSGTHLPPMRVEPLQIPDFMLDGKPIQPVIGYGEGEGSVQRQERRVMAPEPIAMEVQISMFDRLPVPPPSVSGVSAAEEDTLAHGLNPYPSYKDSGSSWLGQVPVHWEVQRQRNVVDMRVSNVDKHSHEGEQPVRLCNYVDVYKNDRITERLPFMRATATAEEIERFRLQVGDVLITKDSESWNDIGVPALVACSAPDLVCGYHLALLRPRDSKIQGSYLLRVQQSQALAFQYHVLANGVTRYGLSHHALKSVQLPVPPPCEQSAIVRFLDYADQRIQRYIRAKKKLIALLNEQKQAIVQRAVTRGLDPDVRLKPSGVEWLGQVPEHWEVHPFTRCAIERADYRGATPTKTESGVFLVTAKNIRKGWIDYNISQEYVARSEYEQIMRRGFPRVGDLLLTTEAPLGNAALVDCEDIALAQRVIRFRFDSHVFVPEFVLHSVLAAYFQDQLLCRGTGSTALGIKASKLPQLEILCPPLAEQVAILEWMRGECLPLDRVAERSLAEIDLLHEFRTRLIADVITGKLDVREAAARLPEEVEEPESLEDGGLGEEEEESEELAELPEEAVA